MAENVPEGLFFLLPYLLPPSVFEARGEFPNCRILFNEICSSTHTSKPSISAEFVLLCRVTVLAWIFWIINILALTTGIIIVVHHYWGDTNWKDVLINSLGLNETQSLCVIALILIIFLVTYNTVKFTCDQKAKAIQNFIKKKNKGNL